MWNHKCLTVIEGGISVKHRVWAAEAKLLFLPVGFSWFLLSAVLTFLVCPPSLSCWCLWSIASNLYKIVLWEDSQFSLQQHQQLFSLPTLLYQLTSGMAEFCSVTLCTPAQRTPVCDFLTQQWSQNPVSVKQLSSCSPRAGMGAGILFGEAAFAFMWWTPVALAPN